VRSIIVLARELIGAQDFIRHARLRSDEQLRRQVQCLGGRCSGGTFRQIPHLVRELIQHLVASPSLATLAPC
jgi:hypothetical protein